MWNMDLLTKGKASMKIVRPILLAVCLALTLYGVWFGYLGLAGMALVGFFAVLILGSD